MAETKQFASYQENKENFFKAVSLQEPDWVPVGLDTNAWTLAMSKTPTYEAQADGFRYAHGKVDIIKDLHPDFVTDLLFSPPAIRIVQALGGTSLSMCDDGYTVQHNMQGEIMHADEYDAFIKDPDRFVMDTLVPRKYAPMRGNKDEMVDAFRRAVPLVLENMKHVGIVTQEMEQAGIIMAWDCFSAPFNPLDILFDFHRGFRGLLTDLRRQPQKVKAAADAIFERQKPQIKAFTQKVLQAPGKRVIPVIGSVFHVVPFLSPKQFEEFWWPYFLQTYLPILEAGSPIFIKGEGKAEHIMPYFAGLPRGTVILQPEDDAYDEIYPKYFKDRMTLCGGIRLNSIKCYTVEQCKDEIKRSFDSYAPGGGFLFCNDRAFMAGSDADPGVVRELLAFAREYGKK